MTKDESNYYLIKFVNTIQSFHQCSICDHIWFQALQL